jgi:hypothetical protein
MIGQSQAEIVARMSDVSADAWHDSATLRRSLFMYVLARKLRAAHWHLKSENAYPSTSGFVCWFQTWIGWTHVAQQIQLSNKIIRVYWFVS